MTKLEREELREAFEKIRKAVAGIKSAKGLKEAKILILEAVEAMEALLVKDEDKPVEEEVDEDDFA